MSRSYLRSSANEAEAASPSRRYASVAYGDVGGVRAMKMPLNGDDSESGVRHGASGRPSPAGDVDGVSWACDRDDVVDVVRGEALAAMPARVCAGSLPRPPTRE
jgi:hypothetical protein